jgi:serine/threonine-protein phosphatase PGAM5
VVTGGLNEVSGARGKVQPSKYWRIVGGRKFGSIGGMKVLIALLGSAWAAGFCLAQPAVPPPAPAVGQTFTRTIYLVRHGNYDDATKGDEEVVNRLTPLGLAQARLVAARLAGMPVTFSSLTSSTMTRARQTAAVINQSLPQLKLQLTPLLRECTPRTWRADIMKDTTPAEAAAAEVQLNTAFAKYFVPAQGADQHDILVCHGNVIRYLVTKALGVETQAWLGFTVAHGSLTIIQVNDKGACKILAVGDTGHIPPNLQSGLTRAGNPQLIAP